MSALDPNYTQHFTCTLFLTQRWVLSLNLTLFELKSLLPIPLDVGRIGKRLGTIYIVFFFTVCPNLFLLLSSLSVAPFRFLNLLSSLFSVTSCSLLLCAASLVVDSEFSEPHSLTGFLKGNIWERESLLENYQWEVPFWRCIIPYIQIAYSIIFVIAKESELD